MSKQLIVKSWDDLHEAEGDKIEATSTIVFVYNGLATQIDLTSKHRQEFEDFIRPYQKAGRKPENPESAEPGRKGYNYKPGAKARKMRLREWADTQMAANPAMVTHYSYVTDGGQYYYPKRLRDDYRAITGENPD